MNSNSLRKGLMLAVLLLAPLRAAPIEGAVIVANDSVALESISLAALRDLYTGRTTYWQDGESVIIIVLAEKTDPALKEISGMEPSQFRTFWQRMVFSGRGRLPKTATDAAGVAALIAANKGAIAIVPADMVQPGAKQLQLK